MRDSSAKTTATSWQSALFFCQLLGVETPSVQGEKSSINQGELRMPIVGNFLSSDERTALNDLLTRMERWVGTPPTSVDDVISRYHTIYQSMSDNGLAGPVGNGTFTFDDSDYQSAWSAYLENKIATVKFSLTYDLLSHAQSVLDAQRPKSSDGTTVLSAADYQAVVQALNSIGLMPPADADTKGFTQSQFDSYMNLMDQARMYYGTIVNLASQNSGGASDGLNVQPLVSVSAGLSRSLYSNASFYRTMLALPGLTNNTLKNSIQRGLSDFFGNFVHGSDGYQYDTTLTSRQNAERQLENFKSRLSALDASFTDDSDFKRAWFAEKDRLLEKYTVDYIADSYNRTAQLTTGDAEYDAIRTDARLAGQLEANTVNKDFEDLFDTKFTAEIMSDSSYTKSSDLISGLRNNLQGLKLIGSFLSAGSIADAITNIQSKDQAGSAQYIQDVMQVAAWVASALQVPVNVAAQMIIQKVKGDSTLAPLNKFVDGLSSASSPATQADLGPALEPDRRVWTFDDATKTTIKGFSDRAPLTFQPKFGEELGKGAIFIIADIASLGLNVYSLDLAIKSNNLGAEITQAFSLAGGTSPLIADLLPIIADGAKVADAGVYLAAVGQVLGLAASGYTLYSAVKAFQNAPGAVSGLSVLDSVLQTVSAIAGPALYVSTCGLSVFLPNFASIAQAVEYQKMMNQYSSWGLNHEWQIFDAWHKIKSLDSTPIVNWFSGVYTEKIQNDQKARMNDAWFQAAALERASYNFNKTDSGSKLIADLRGAITSSSNLSDVIYLRNASEDFDYFGMPRSVGLIEGVDVTSTASSVLTSSTEEVHVADYMNWVDMKKSTVRGLFVDNFTITDPDHAGSTERELVIVDTNNGYFGELTNVTIDDSAGSQAKVYKIVSPNENLTIKGGSGDDIFIMPSDIGTSTITISGGGGSDTVSFVQKTDGSGQAIDFSQFTGIKAVVGSAGDDRVDVNASGNATAAQLSADHWYSWGGGGNDSLYFVASSGDDSFVLGTSSSAYLGTGDNTIFFQDAVSDSTGWICGDNTDGTEHVKSLTVDYKEMAATYNNVNYSSVSVTDKQFSSGLDSELKVDVSGTGSSGAVTAETDLYGATALILPDWNDSVTLTGDSYLNAISFGNGNNTVSIGGNTGVHQAANGGLICAFGTGRNTVNLSGTSQTLIKTSGSDQITLTGQASSAIYLDGAATEVDASGTTGNVSISAEKGNDTYIAGAGLNAIDVKHAGVCLDINDHNNVSGHSTVIGFDNLTDDQLVVSVDAAADTLTLQEHKGDGSDSTIRFHGSGVNSYIELNYGDTTKTVLAVDQLIQVLAGLAPLEGAGSTYTVTQLKQAVGSLLPA
ncbi:hypothetical protein ACEPT7_03270 [Burkholderia ubonensis]|uniref:hypothetical protein n=1 Tax=Burkholderia ubonensis TaxID=101571 RepID=UPI00358F0426